MSTAYGSGYIEEHPYLGYGASKDSIFKSKKCIKNEEIYNVTYTIKDRLRYTPNSNEKSQNCVLFFGCSFTYGEGLSDSSTLPFYFNQFAKNEYKILNYGFHGYGTNHMLALIENRVTKDIQGCKNKKIAIYSFIPDHVARAAGYRELYRRGAKGPRYAIINGKLKKVGDFSESWGMTEKILSQSYTYRRLFAKKLKPSHYDFIRVVEIIKKSKELLFQDGVILYVFIWDYKGYEKAFINTSDYDYFLDEMEKNNIITLFLHDAIPDYDEKKQTYIIPNDGHPNCLANEKIAKYLYSQIIEINIIDQK